MTIRWTDHYSLYKYFLMSSLFMDVISTPCLLALLWQVRSVS